MKLSFVYVFAFLSKKGYVPGGWGSGVNEYGRCYIVTGKEFVSGSS